MAAIDTRLAAAVEQIAEAGTGRRALDLAEVIRPADNEPGPLGEFPERHASNGNGRSPI